MKQDLTNNEDKGWVYRIFNRNSTSKSTRKEKQEITMRQNETNCLVNENNPSSIAVIYRSELDYISRCILDYPNIETGGELFGFWTSTGTPIVAYVTGPGNRAQHNYTSFLQDPDYPNMIGIPLYNKYRLQHIGQWHSHHQIDLAHPSGGDVNSFASGLGKPGFPRLLLCIGNCTPAKTTVNAFNFHKNNPSNYVHAKWDIIETQSPYRALADQDLKSILIHPQTSQASHGHLETLHNQSDINTLPTHWLTESIEHVEIMKVFVNDTKTMFPDYVVITEMLPSGEPVINIQDGLYEIIIPYGFPNISPLLKSNTISAEVLLPLIEESADRWNSNGSDLTKEYKEWIKSIVLHHQNNITTPNDNINSDKTSTVGHCTKLEERLSKEKVVLNHYISSNSYLFIDKLVDDGNNSNVYKENYLYILSCLPDSDFKVLIKFTLNGFPEKQPEVEIGFCDKCYDSAEIQLSNLIREIQFDRLGYVIQDSKNKIFSDLLKWSSMTSLFKAYIIVLMIVNYKMKSEKESRNILDYISPLLADETLLNETWINFMNSIIDNNNI